MAFTNAPKRSNVTENWLFQFTADNKNCLDFDGSNDTINFGNILSTPFVNFTIEFWCKADVINSGVVIQLSSGSGEDEDENASFNVNLQSGGEFRLFYEYGSGSNETNTTSSFDLSADTWTHVAVVRDDSSGEAYFYKNGALVETETASNDPTGGTSSDANMTIGNSFANSNGFNGELAHVRIWNTARSASEISHYYKRLVDSNDSGLVGYWKLDEGTGTSVADSSSNSNNGTISGATWSINGFDNFIHAFGIAFKDTTVSSEYYVGSILNNSIIVRDSIDLVASTSSTGNISLTSANFKRHGTDFYKLLFNGTNNYHNKEVRVFAQFDNEDTLSNCQQVFSGRIVEMTLDQNQNITMQINAHRPWDRIEFPQVKHEKYNIYEPVVYGSYTYSDASSGATNDAAFGGVFPVPILYTDRNIITTLMPKSYGSGSHSYLHHYIGFDHFCSLKLEGSGIVDTTSTQNGVNILETPITHRATGWIRTNQSSFDFSGSVTYLTNPENATDYNLNTGAADTSTFATATITADGDLRYLTVQTPNKQFAVTVITDVYIKHGVTSTTDHQQYNIDFFGNQYDPTADDLLSSPITRQLATNISTHLFSFNTTPDNAIASENALLCPDELLIKWAHEHAPTAYDHEDHTLKVYDIQMRYENRFNYNDDDAKRLADLDHFYCGGAGLTASWDSGAISHGHDAHRDLLQRFGGISSTEPDNWSSLNTDRAIDNWKVRYWQLEPTSLQEALDKLAYEFGFVAKFTPTGTLKYIHVKKSSELSVTTSDHNLTKNDINNVEISTSGLSNIITKMEISNKLHAAESNRYYKTTSSTNSTARAKYNLGDKEGIATINLDHNVGTIPTTADSDCNADWYSYYNNIIGDMKIIVECDVVNPAKGYQLETGDIITFTDMPAEMFGTDFSTSKYFMITETQRSLGNVSIVAREVG